MATETARDRHALDEQAWERVWDPFVRLAHWTLAVAFVVAYVSEDDPLTLHVWAGYVVGTIVLLRILWGLFGPRHARFIDFVYRPDKVVLYLRDLMMLRGRRYLGHSPAGGAMVFVLLILLAGVVWSGLGLYAIEEGKGPLVGIVTAEGTLDLSPVTTARADDDDDDDDDDDERDEGAEANEEFWEEIHETLANITLVMVILHVAGVLLASFVHRENLVGAMVTGRKRAERDH